MEFAYFPGCSAQGSSLDYELSTEALCKKLGITLKEIPDWNCCGSTPAHATSHELSAALCARNLDIAAKTGAKKLVTPCPSCLSNLLAAKERMEDPNFRNEVNSLLDEPCVPNLPDATSVMQAIGENISLEQLKNLTKRSLKGLRLAAYYGCLMSRPPERMHFEDPENPMLMERMLEACGAEVVDFPLKTACCGAAFGIPKRKLTQLNSAKILTLACNLKVDALIVACPLCQMNLDLRQAQAEDVSKRSFRLPILYYTQILGLALGIEEKDLSLNKLVVSCDKLLTKWKQALKLAEGA